MAQDDEAPVPLESEDEAPLPLAGENEDLEPLPLVGAEGAAAEGSSKIHAFGAHAAGISQERQFTRTVNLTGTGATRVRVFHSKITVAAIEHMANQINEWLDGDQVEVKCVTQVVGVMEGKKPEPNIILTVWY